jgi:hypothetical protein
MDKFAKSYSNFSQQRTPKSKRGFFSWRKKNQNSAVSTRTVMPAYSASSRVNYSRTNSAKNWRKILWLGALIVSVFVWLALMLYLPYFRIYQVTFEGLNIIEPDDIQNYTEQKYLHSGVIPTNNYFLVRASAIKTDLLNKYSLNSAEVVKIFPGKIHITIQEKNTSIVYDNGKTYSLLDKNGSVIKILFEYAPAPAVVSTSTAPIAVASAAPEGISAATSTTSTPLLPDNGHKPDWRKLSKDSTAGLPILYDRRGLEIWEKKTDIIPADIIQAVIDWQTALEQETIGESRYFEINNPSAGVIAHLDRPWLIFFQPRNPLAEQITNLKVILNSRTANPAEYIDLRFGDRVFWK